MAVPKILKELFSLPTASFAESAIADRIRSFCRPLKGVSCRCDRYGNLLVHYRHRPRPVTPLVFAAHLDHPGFVAQETLDRRTLRAAFRGYVESDYFSTARVRFWTDGEWVTGKVTELTKTIPVARFGVKTSRPTEVLLRVPRPVTPGAAGVWDLPAPVLKGDRMHALYQDDLAGAGALLTLLQRLAQKRARAEVYCLFTRAEEVGFVGAIAAAKARTVSRKLPIIVVEASKELPSARMGDGPILRVGDRLSIYTPALTAFMVRVAERLSKRRRTFAFQRKLMDGGACEATAYMALGYRTTGVCLALGNYHNMDTDRRRIAPEIISLTDWRREVDLFEAMVMDEAGCDAPNTAIAADLETRFESFRPLLGDGNATRRRR